MTNMAKVLKVTEQYVEACRRMDEAEKEKKTLASALLLMIPVGEVVGGVKHIKDAKGTPSWKSIAERIGKELVPASRRQLIEPIIEACTSEPKEYVKRVGE